MQRIALVSILISPLLINGCAQQGIANQDEFDQLAHQKAEEYVGKTRSALEKAEDVYGQAKSQQLNVLAPLHWQQLSDAIKKARTADLEGNNDASVEAAAWVMTYFESAQKVKAQVETQLGDVLAQQAVLLELKSDRILKRDYRDLIGELKKLARDIESGQAKDIADDAAELLEEMQELELNTMLEIHWRPARDTLDKAEDEGTDDFAPETFAIAERLTRKARYTIREQYQNREICDGVGIEALRASQHALYIGREAEKIINMDIDDAEEAALRFEGYLHQVSTALGAGDLRNMAFLDQTLALVQKAGEQKSAAEKPLLKQIEQLQSQLAALQAQLRSEESASSTETTANPSADSDAKDTDDKALQESDAAPAEQEPQRVAETGASDSATPATKPASDLTDAESQDSASDDF